MSRFPIPFVSTIPALAIVLLLMSVAETTAAERTEITTSSSDFEMVIIGGDGSEPGPPVPTLNCEPTDPQSPHGFTMEILFNEPVSQLTIDDLEISHPANVRPFTIMVHDQSGTDSSFSFGANFYSSNGAASEELEVTVRVPAGVARDRSGNFNTASDTLHVSLNRTVSVADASATEGTDATLDFEVTLGSRNDCDTVTVDWTTAGENSFAAAARGTLMFGPGETRKTVSVPVLNGTVSDGGETVTLRLSNATLATIDDAEATGTIAGSEPPEPGVIDTDSPAVTVTSEAVGPVSGDFDVTLTFSEPTSDFEMSEIEVVNGSATSMSSRIDGMVRTVTITPNSDTGAGARAARTGRRRRMAHGRPARLAAVHSEITIRGTGEASGTTSDRESGPWVKNRVCARACWQAPVRSPSLLRWSQGG